MTVIADWCAICHEIKFLTHHDDMGRLICEKCWLKFNYPPNDVNAPPDDVSRPNHYIFGPYEVRPVLLEWIKCSGIPADEAADWFSMMQYLMRYTRKGKPKRDLLKARKYLEWLIERHDGD